MGFALCLCITKAKLAIKQNDKQEFDKGSEHMSKGTAKEKRIIALAYFHRYGWIAIMTGLILLIPQYALLIVSLCFIAISLWSLIGYKLKWKHIYCSHQNAHRKDMTPHHISWTHINFGRDIAFSAELCYNGTNKKPLLLGEVAA